MNSKSSLRGILGLCFSLLSMFFVFPSCDEGIPLIRIVFETKEGLTLNVGDSSALSVKFEPEDTTNKDISWFSSNKAVAIVDEFGLVTAKAAGSATITAVPRYDAAKKVEYEVTVSEKETVPVRVESVELGCETLSLREGETAKLECAVLPETADDKSVSWESDDDSVASVDARGVVSAHKVGSVTVTVRTSDGGKVDSCIVTVKYAPLPGKFSVSSDGKMVQFSKGNLYHSGTDASTGWAFEDNQYDFRTWPKENSANAIIGGALAQTPVKSCGLFFWSSDAAKSSALNYADASAGIADVLFAASGSVMDSEWNALTRNEMEYLIGNSGARKDKGGLAKIRFSEILDKDGFVLLPDAWEDPYQNCFNPNATSFVDNTYDIRQWNAMQEAGAVFLPVAGQRDGAYVALDGAVYWLKDAAAQTTGNGFAFGTGNALGEVRSLSRNQAFSIRLVMSVED